MPSPSAESRRLPRAPVCPFCDGRETELMNAFGSHASVSTYWCRACRSPFELLKWKGGSVGTMHEEGDAAGGRDGAGDGSGGRRPGEETG